MEAICKICGETKSVEEFDKILRAGPREPWNLRRCKSCTHRVYAQARQKPSRRAASEQAARNWKKANPERHAALAREYRQRHPEKIRAQNRLNYAIRKGRLERQPCEACGTTEKVHAHHDDYEKWYDVRWLCYVCHKLEHGA